MQGIELMQARRWSSTSSACSARPTSTSPRRSTSSIAPSAIGRQSAVHSAGRVRPGRASPALHHHPRAVRPVPVRDLSTSGGPSAARCASASSTTSPRPSPDNKPGTCTMHETCDSYVVVEYNGDVFPCDFFVEKRLEARQHQPRLLARDRAPPEALHLRRQKDARPAPNARSASTSQSATAAAPNAPRPPARLRRTWTTSAGPIR